MKSQETRSVEPEPFPPELLQQPPGARQEYFEQHCLIEHARLLEALDVTLQSICPPGEGASMRRPGTMVLVIGPSRVGKTTLIRLLEERLLSHTTAQMQSDPSFMPFASVTAAGPDSGRFDWQDYYRAVLRSLHDPFVDGKTARIPARALREAMETALIERRPLAVIVDEAHHLAKAASGRRLQDQLDHLKHFENVSGISHILVGTYEMRPFRRVNAQLACRGIDVHFPRYDAAKEEDAQVFRSVLWALQRQLPLEQEPRLVEQWEFLYARSIGCTALPEGRVELALRNALESEADLAEAPGADERLLTLLGLRGAQGKPAASKVVDEAQAPSRRSLGRPGKRAPGRDLLTPEADGGGVKPPEEQAAG